MGAPPPRQEQPQPPPSPPRPLISEAVVDAPTQRSYLAALFVLVQAYKLAEALWPSQRSAPPQLDQLAVNWRLWKWIAVDLVFVAFVALLKVPRLVWGWKARWVLRLSLCALDYVLFGRWTVSLRRSLVSSVSSFLPLVARRADMDEVHPPRQLAASVFVPTALRNLFVRTMSTDEHSVRLASIMGSEKERLGQSFTVRVLAVS